MSAELKGIRLAVIGGDDRELYFMAEMKKLGAYITGAGFERADPLPDIVLTSQKEAVQQADVLIFPMYGTDEGGVIKAKYARDTLVLNQEILQFIPASVPLLIGWARPALKSAAARLGIPIIETANVDEVAILNSIPSAEGAIQLAMQNTKITLHGSRSFVLGLGRTGWTLAARLQALGAQVSGVARQEQDLAKATACGFRPLRFAQLDSVISEAEIIFNTVPALVLNHQRLETLSPDTVIIDLASFPGGTDFAYAQRLGIKALLAPGLPGMVAPKTAGKILAQVYPQLILRQLATPVTSVQ
ncbi:MAG: dipicolinate synthase subunit DpsA [Peptococcaceae bacterium]|jgi:dipicolinate synthase subunit A|nr:dipicolinate synthase subunit DpsA [Peptococcaceae bacterium]